MLLRLLKGHAKTLLLKDGLSRHNNRCRTCAAFRQCQTETSSSVLVSVEGNIGAGKSSVLPLIEQNENLRGEAELHPEPLDKWQRVGEEEGTNILAAFYKNPHRWAYTFQVRSSASLCLPPCSIKLTEKWYERVERRRGRCLEWVTKSCLVPCAELCLHNEVSAAPRGQDERSQAASASRAKRVHGPVRLRENGYRGRPHELIGERHLQRLVRERRQRAPQPHPRSLRLHPRRPLSLP